MLSGRTGNNRMVNFEAPRTANGNPGLIGQFVDVEITEVMTHSLRGRMLPAMSRRAAGA